MPPKKRKTEEAESTGTRCRTRKERGTNPGGTLASGDPEAIRGIVPGDITGSSNSGQQGHMVTDPSVRLSVHVPHVPQNIIHGQQPGIGAANNILEFDYPVPCMPAVRIHNMSLSSDVSQNLKTKLITPFLNGQMRLLSTLAFTRLFILSKSRVNLNTCMTFSWGPLDVGMVQWG